MKNNAHLNESFEKRLARFENGSPVEAIETLLNSIDNFFNNEIRATIGENQNPQTSLMFLGVHACILTISEAFFDDKGMAGYKRFLEEFIDKADDPNKFSLIAHDIHKWRNVVAHQWLSARGHQISYAYELNQGWKKEDNLLHVNPRIYCTQYLEAFMANGKIWNYSRMFTEIELEAIKRRIIDKFIKV